MQLVECDDAREMQMRASNIDATCKFSKYTCEDQLLALSVNLVVRAHCLCLLYQLLTLRTVSADRPQIDSKTLRVTAVDRRSTIVTVRPLSVIHDYALWINIALRETEKDRSMPTS